MQDRMTTATAHSASAAIERAGGKAARRRSLSCMPAKGQSSVVGVDVYVDVFRACSYA